MPSIRKVTDATVDGEEGFIITWEMIGYSKQGAQFRALASTGVRFPTTITTSKVAGVQEFGEKDFNVNVFVPTEGFMSAGVPSPREWLEENFGDRLNP